MTVMRRVIAIFILISILSVTFSACEHTCEFVQEWSFDESLHWHDCEKKRCELRDQEDEHTWDEGVVTAKATQEASGVTTYTCTVCDYKKTEELEFTGMSKSDWNVAFQDKMFENFTYREEVFIEYDDDYTDYETKYEIIPNKCKYYTRRNNSENEGVLLGEDRDEIKDDLVKTIRTLCKYESFKYDPETKSYKVAPGKSFAVPHHNSTTKDARITFIDGRVSEIFFTDEMFASGKLRPVETRIYFSDYGTTAAVYEP